MTTPTQADIEKATLLFDKWFYEAIDVDICRADQELLKERIAQALVHEREKMIKNFHAAYSMSGKFIY